MGKWMDGYLEKLAANRRENLEGGGADRIERQHQLGKLTARERIERLADPGTFEEIGSLVREFRFGLAEVAKPSPSDGVVMGLARVKGRPVMAYSLDFTVMSGSIGDQGVWKIAELVQMAGQEQMPVIGMFDSAGSRISLKGGYVGLNGLGRLIRNYCLYSGVIPQIALVLGPCTGPLAQVPVLSNFLIMNEKTGFLWLGGENRIGGGRVGRVPYGDQRPIRPDGGKRRGRHRPGQATVRLFRRTAGRPQPPKPRTTRATGRGPAGHHARQCRFTYDVHEIIDLIVDDGEFFELKEDFAPNMVVEFARFDGIVRVSPPTTRMN